MFMMFKFSFVFKIELFTVAKISGDFTGPMNYIRASLRKPSEIAKKKVPSSVPVLLIWGTRDGALSTELAEMSRAYAANFQLKFIEGASHWVQQDEPTLVNKYIWKFVNDERL